MRIVLSAHSVCLSRKARTFAQCVSLTVLAAVFASSALAKPIQIPRQPDYHAGKIAFSYHGDIWVVNEDGSNPRRLTVHPARDMMPRWSPDGKWIAFTSNRYGNNDVFIIPAEGGEPKQLTFHTGNDTAVGWTRDSKRVLLVTSRGANFPGIGTLYSVSINGGLEEMLPIDRAAAGSYSPDGNKIVYNRHTLIWWRKHYRGSGSADLWVMDAAKKSYSRLLDNDVPDNKKPINAWPMYGNNGEIYFVSDREVVAEAGSREVMKSTNNIWKISENGGKPTQVTHHKDGSLFYPAMSSDGKVIVYEENFGLWKLDVANGKSTEVKVDIVTDTQDNNFEVLTVTAEADSFHLSPSTRRAAISTHGEIFTIATDRGDISRVTNSYSRETDPQWSPDGKWMAYVSDTSGREEVWISDMEGKNAKKLSNADTEKSSLHWMPDSKSLAYTASDHKLYVVNVETGDTKTIVSNDVGNIQGVSVSPDGKWFAYVKADHDLRSHVYIVSAAGGEEHKLSDDRMFASFSPRWTPDGRKLIFLGGYVQGGSATLRENVAALYNVSLTKEDKDPISRDIDDEESAKAADRAAADRGPRPAGDTRPDVKIDFEGMDRRIRQVTRLTDSIQTAVPAPDSRSYAFVATVDVEGRPTPTLYIIQESGDQLRRITQVQPRGPEDGPPGGGGGFGGGISSLQFSRDGRSIYFMEANGIWAVTVGAAGEAAAPAAAAAAAAGRGGAGADAGRRRVNFTARVEVDNREERKQMFNEAWRVMKHRFYDAQMNGVDWAKMRTVYEPLLADVEDREELHNVVLQMIGELNASHTGLAGGGQPERNPIQTRNPGFELTADSSGYYKVSVIYKDGPADRDYVKIKVGDYILAVNGAALKSGDNYWRNYNLAPGRKFEFLVNSKPATDGAWTSKVEPVAGQALATLQYDKWVEERRQMVEKMSGGEVGYLHIRAMNQPSLRKFERDLADNHFKKALIIDQRFNGGGGIDQELLEILQQRQYQYTRNRDSIYVTRPQRAYFGPLVVMQNERSFSDAEVFPDGFRTLKLGKVVGVYTNSSVIGTGAFRMIDGAMLRTPGTGLWNVNGQNLENYGVPPDVYVDNPPTDYFQGKDSQLEKAVEVLKEEIKKLAGQKVLPGRQ